ncbi:MAG: glycosyltransferase family 4 protein [Desulfobacteraceae bacterium]|nr:glycosyltransferase family 4 protein [Desulfobacteraceae bacterium]
MRGENSIKVLFLAKTENLGASSRCRVYEYLPFINDNKKIDATIMPAVENDFFKLFNNNPTTLYKVKWFVSIFIKRIYSISKIKQYDCVFIQKETIPYFFPLSEILITLFAKKTIFDFDDAIFIYPKSPNLLMKIFRDKKNIERILKRVDHIVLSNQYLADYSKKFNRNITIIPTSIDTNRLIPCHKPNTTRLCIGWIGSVSTVKYISILFDVFKKLAMKYDFDLKIIGGGNIGIDGVNVECIEWTLKSELTDLQSMDIGVMPLIDDEWTRGKGAYKLLQYMAVGIPSISSKVGFACEFIEDGKNGFIANRDKDWYNKLSLLIENEALRRTIGIEGRKTIEDKFSIQKNAEKLVDVLLQNSK